MRWIALLAAALVLGVAGAQAKKAARAEPEEKPILQLDTGGHMGVIKGLAFTPDGNFIVSAGDDKVIRVWDWRAGKTVRTIRGQSEPGPGGFIYAMALSPDGRWLAVGGWFPGTREQSDAVRLYDFASGELKALLKGHGNVVYSLAFSPDGKHLISGSGDAIVWDVEEAKLLHRLKGHRDFIFAVGFTADGARAVTGSFDNSLRLWSVANGALLKEMTGHSDKVFALAVSPNDDRIASGDESGEIRLWDGKSGNLLQVFAKQGGGVGSLRFSPEGKILLSTCGHGRGVSCSDEPQIIWNIETGQRILQPKKHDNVVPGSSFSPVGAVVATGGGSNHEIHAWDPKTGETKAVLRGSGRPNWAVGFSADGRNIAWGNALGQNPSPNNYGPVEIALRLPSASETLSQPELVKNAEGWIHAKASFGALSLQHRKGGTDGYNAFLDLLKDGTPSGVSIGRGLGNGSTHLSYSFAPDGNSLISGGFSGTLTAYALDGKKIGDFVGHDGNVYAVAPSPDGRYLVSGANDQTVRLWNLKTRELLVTIFRGEDGEWVMWTPQGYYAGSPGADKIVGWQINKGPDKAADYVTAEQLRKHLSRPDIVAKAIQLASAEEAVRTSYGTGFKLSDLLSRPAPHLRIVSPTADSTVKTTAGVNVTIALDATPDPITRIRIQVNGRQLDDFLPEDGPSFAAGNHPFPVPLAKGKNTIVVTALNEIGWSKVQDGALMVTNESAGELDRRGTLYILAIGVSKYPNIPQLCRPKSTCDLDFTGADATAFAESMSARLGPLHSKVVRRVLVNGGEADDAPTAANILDALGVLREAGPNDTVAVFLAGHGINDGPNYRFISTDAAISNSGALKPSSVVPWYAIEEAIDGAKGRRLLFIDTCHSAGAYNQRLGNAAYYANILAYSSARWDQEALESEDFKHGLFTYALVEGMTGAADLNHDGHVDTAELAEYLRKRVPQLAAKIKGEQEPQFFKGRDAETYPLVALH